MSSNNYIPRNDMAFYEWAMTVYAYSIDNSKRWLVASVDPLIKRRLDDFKQLVDKCNQPTKSKVDTLEKNEARKSLEKDMRNYVQGMVAHNVNVTNKDREMMSLPIYDTTPTKVGEPQGLATADIAYLGGQVLELIIRHVDGTPFDKKANYGCKIYFGIYADSDPKPQTGEDLTKHRFTRRKKEIFEFSPSDVKKTACFCIRYENSKGVQGPWGAIVSAVIP